MKVILSHPTANANVRALANGLTNANMLYEFYTCIATFPNDILDKLSKYGPLSELRRRQFEKELEPFTHTWPWHELARHISMKMGLTKFIKHEKGIFSIDAVFRNLDKKIASILKKTMKSDDIGIYSYEDGALDTFRKARTFGIQCNYELPIAHWRAIHRILKEENLIRPDWAITMTGLTDSKKKLLRKDEELQSADRIFVASSYTAKSLEEFPGKLPPIHVIPYGFPSVTGLKNYERLVNRPLNIIFVGGLSQRKGIATLLEAVEGLGNNIKLTIVGRKIEENCEPLNLALKQHNWIETLSHSDVLQLMRKNDILVLPTLVEGFGLVITEAMSQGTPVITTERGAGPDLIRHDENGWIINAGSVESLRSTIEYILNHPDTVEKNGINALESAKKRPWSVYGIEMASILSNEKISSKTK